MSIQHIKQFYERHAATIDLLVIMTLIAFFYSLFLGSRPLAVPDEARYSEIPREMWLTGHFITPHLNFIKYFEKPPLFYWLQTLSIALFGLSEWSMRLMPMLLGVLGCGMTFSTTRTLFNKRTAIFASIILASSLLYYGMAHLITLDMAVSAWITGCLLSFLLAINAPSSKKRRHFMWACAVFSSLAVLTKGLIGLILPGMVIGLWILCFNQWRLLPKLFLTSSLLLFLAITLPWHLAVQHKNPEFFHFYFVTQQFSRYLTDVAGRYKPNWFFIPILLLGFFPWVSFLYQTLRHHVKQLKHAYTNHAHTGFLLLWFLSIFVFYSLSHSKLIPYIVPVFPPLAILTALYLTQENTQGIKAGFVVYALFSLLIATAIACTPQFYPVPNPMETYRYLVAFASLSMLGPLLSYCFYKRYGLMQGFITIALTSVLAYTVIMLTIPHVDSRSIKPLAETINAHIKPSDLIVSYKHYYQDLPFYTRKRVIIVDWHNELDFGTGHQADAKQWMLDIPQFLTLWQQPQTLYMVTSIEHLDDLIKEHPAMHFYVLASTFRNRLVTNKEPPL